MKVGCKKSFVLIKDKVFSMTAFLAGVAVIYSFVGLIFALAKTYVFPSWDWSVERGILGLYFFNAGFLCLFIFAECIHDIINPDRRQDGFQETKEKRILSVVDRENTKYIIQQKAVGEYLGSEVVKWETLIEGGKEVLDQWNSTREPKTTVLDVK